MSALARRSSRERIRRAAAFLVAVALAAGAAAELGPGHAAGAAPSAGLPVPEPDLSLPAIPSRLSSGGSSFVMLGADTGGEAFAYTLEPQSQLALASVAGKPVPSDWTPPASSSAPAHFVIFQRTGAGGWHLTQEALDAGGAPLPAFLPTGYAGSGIVPAGQVAPGGSAAIAGTDGSNGPERILARDPGGQFRAAPEPPAGLLGAQETLFDQNAPALAPVDDSAHGGVLVAPFTTSPSSQPLGVLHYDGSAWTREPILPPAPAGTQIQRVLAISATALGNAYLLAQTSDPGAGIALFKRETGNGGPHWAAVGLTGQRGLQYASSSGPGYSQLGPLHPEGTSESDYPQGLAAAGAQPLSATASGAWVDGAFRDSQGNPQSFTANVSVSEATGGPQGSLHSWCNSPAGGICDDSVPAGLPAGMYRSIAFSGDGAYGSRIVTGLPGGAILSLQGTTFQRIPGLGSQPQVDGSAAFLSPTEGWTGGGPPTHFTPNPGGDQLQAWPTPFREPLTALAGEPGHARGAVDAQAIAVGDNGEVARYLPGQGWSPEALLTAAGVRATPRLRAVAWPTEDFAYAVGDRGQMWRWNRATATWERDPGTPLNFSGDLTGVAFAPSDPNRGYAVGLGGVLLRYDKSWSQETLPPGLAQANFTSVTFAGSEAIAAFQGAQPSSGSAGASPSSSAVPDSGLLINNGNGWVLDSQEQTLTTPPASGSAGSRPIVSIVSGLPDGGAIAAGDGVILERDAGGGPWRLGRDPLPGFSVVAAAAIRSGTSVQALLSVDPLEPNGRWPAPSTATTPQCATSGGCAGNQGLPTIFGTPDLPENGWLLRETASGWQDVQHNAFPNQVNAADGADNPTRDDEIQALLVDPGTAQGWAVGGETGSATNAGLLSNNSGVVHLHTAGIYRYPPAATPPSGASSSPPSLDSSGVTVALAGGAICQQGCAARDPRIGLGPPAWLDHAIGSAVTLSAHPGGPRAFIYTGGILSPVLHSRGVGDPTVQQEISYFAGHADGSAGSLPFAPVISPGEVFGGGATQSSPSSAFRQSFSAPSGVRGNFPDYYGFDLPTPGGAGSLRVVVIDIASSAAVQALAGRDAGDAQYQFLTGELAGARSAHVPTIVVGSRTLSTQSVNGDTPPTGAAAVAKLLLDDGVSAYFYDSPNSNAHYDIPTGAPQTIPSYGTGSLGYEAWTSSANRFGESGYLLASVNPSQVDPTSGRAPVKVRLIPNISELAIDARDGTTLRRSQVAQFAALARRPRAGTGQTSGGSPVGPDPYITIPANPCSFACSARVDPEFSFSSSHPDIGDFVRHDPASLNPRAVFLGATGRPLSDSQSGIFCAFNAGTTTISVTTGGLSFSETITVLGGALRQPCGTRPIAKPPTKFVRAPGVTPPPPSPVPASSPPPTQLSAPPPPAPAPAHVAAPVPAPVPAPVVHAPSLPVVPKPASLPAPFVPRTPPVAGIPAAVLSVAPPPPPPSFPSGFSGVSAVISQPVSATEKREEREKAIEEAQQFAAYEPHRRQIFSPTWAIAIVILLAATGTSVRSGRARRRRAPAYALAASFRDRPRR